MQKYSETSVLLLLQNNSQNAQGHLPGKLFEYIGANRNILCVGNKDSDLAEILKRTNSGEVFNEGDALILKKFLKDNYLDWKSGSVTNNSENISAFGRRQLTHKLSELLNAITQR